MEKLDTNVDTTTVDTPPSFEACNPLIEKEAKTQCFRKTIHQEISASLQKQQIKVRKPIDETVEVIITIHANQTASLKSIKASAALLKEIPDLQQRIEKAIAELPKIYAAIKRGIPVTSEYTLPIRIKLKN